MASPRPSIQLGGPADKTSYLQNVSQKASTYHSRIPYLRRLPFPAIAIIVTLIVVNLLVWAAVGVVLVRLSFCYKRLDGEANHQC